MNLQMMINTNKNQNTRKMETAIEKLKNLSNQIGKANIKMGDIQVEIMKTIKLLEDAK